MQDGGPESSTLLDEPAPRTGDREAKGAFLFLVLECGRPEAGGSRHALVGVHQVLLGRGAERHAERRVEQGVRSLVLRVPDRRISTAHARLVRTDDAWMLEDVGSKNGTLLNGRRTSSARLRDGDIVQVGHAFFRFRADVRVPEGTQLDTDSSACADATAGLATLLPVIAASHRALARIAPSQVSVLLLGETGTGKEVLARAIHELSGRKGPFVGVNCGALPEALLEGQLFGHVKGAFSGAARDEPGLVRAADGGTLFLDEIGDLAEASQAALLRVLQEREVVPVGATRPVPVDIRVVAATHRDLDARAASGSFRRDLLGRLSGYRHQLVPLRERREDLGLLVSDLCRGGEAEGKVRELRPEAAQCLLGYDWPLNIRELSQALAAAAVLAEGAPLEPAHLPAVVAGAALQGAPAAPPSNEEPVRDAQSDDDLRLRAELVALLERHEGNVSEVARAAGKARMQIHRWMRRFGIDPSAFREP